MDCYFGTYQKFNTVSKKEAAVLLGPDSIIGDFFDIRFKKQDNKQVAWIVNKFDVEVGFFDDDFSRKLMLFKAREWNLKAVLSYVAFTDTPEPGFYWGEAAVFCYDPTQSESVDPFITQISKRISENVRPDIELSQHGISQVLDSKGAWVPSNTIPMPEKQPGTAIVKSRRSVSEKLIEQGRKGNIGCYIVSWAFLLFLVASVVFGLKSCGVF